MWLPEGILFLGRESPPHPTARPLGSQKPDSALEPSFSLSTNTRGPVFLTLLYCILWKQGEQPFCCLSLGNMELK